MFGYIRPDVGELKVREYNLYRGVYCGLCRSLYSCGGCLAPLTLQYDFVFLAIVRSALRGEEPAVSEFRCPLRPWKKRCLATLPSSDTAAALSLLTLRHKLADDRADGGFSPKLCLLPATDALRKRVLKSGDDALLAADRRAEESCEALRSLEKRETPPSPDEAAECSGELTAALFAEGLDGSGKRIAEELGRRIGRWVYLVDAADDFRKDRKRGSFNPFAGEETLPADRVRASLLLELDGAAKALELIEFPSPALGSIARNILYLGLPAASERALANAAGEKPPRDPSAAV